MPAPITNFRQAIKAVVMDAHPDLVTAGMPIRDDKLHESLGSAGPVAAIYPAGERAHSESGVTNAMMVVVQVFLRYDLQIDPEQTVDPGIVEQRAFEFQQAVQRATSPRNQGVWFYNVVDIDYPDDPTGNKSRYVVTLEGFGDRPTLIETAG